MCEFCTQHGDGKKWYLEASSYAADLRSDLARRGYVIDFVQGFDQRMTRAVRLMDILSATPKPVGDVVRGVVHRRMKRDHFGQPLPIEDVEAVLDIATSVVQLPCVCRHFAGTPEEGYCLGITVQPTGDLYEEAFSGFAGGPDTGQFQRLTKEEALAVLRRCEAEGLMHSVWTFHTPFIAAICNCNLGAGCMAMRTTLDYGIKVMWKGEYVAGVDAGACTGCRACIERCPFDAIRIDPHTRRAVVEGERCYGCGTCRSACRTGALSLAARASVPALAGSW